jgi:ABC-type Fe3+/spermidine/putrescine transport system ATPase subunit
VTLSIRPEQMRIVPAGAPSDGQNRLSGRPVESTFVGEASEHVMLVNEQRLRVISSPPMFDVPETLAVQFDPADVIVLAE